MSGRAPATASELPDPHARAGTAFGAAAYIIWGTFPLYFRALEPASPWEIVFHRVVWSVVACALILAATRHTSWVRPLLGAPRDVGMLAIASALIGFNWGVYIFAVNTGHVVESALGYFINPLVTVLAGVLVLHERLTRLQWAAVGLGAVAVIVLTVDYGRPPWIALILAFTFATYGLIKNKVGANVGALAGLTTETVLLLPFAAAALVWLELSGRGTVTVDAPWHGMLLASTGAATVVPLLMFAAAARRVPLVMVGLLQFITPVLQLLCGVLLLNEPVPPSRWVGFAIVWVSLVLLTVDSVRRFRSARSARVDANLAAPL